MTRRIFRTILQLASTTVIVTVLIIFLDSRYRVLPASIHDHLPTHHPGSVVTDVNILTCSSLNIFSSCTLNPKIWHRVDKDLYLGTSWTSSAYLHFQSKREEDLLDTDKVVLDLKVSRNKPSSSDDSSSKDDDNKWEARPGGIWLQRTAKRHASDDEQALTSVDVLFGADAVDPRPKWEVKDTPILLDSVTEQLEARITLRRGVPPKPKNLVPRINDSGRFKIMQVADIHFTNGLGQCRHPVPPEMVPGHGCDADPRTLEFLERLLDEEKPDLVIFSGDQINGETTKDSQTAVFKFVKPLAERKILWAAILGNHDDEGSLKRREIMALLEEMPYSLSSAGPKDVDGYGNYIIEVFGSHFHHSALTLYMLDTHAYSPDEGQFPGYDWIKPSQIDWFKTTAQNLKKQHAQYTHIHINLAFIHIPLPEYTNFEAYRKGNWTEPPTAPLFNSGFKNALVEENVLFVSCGHDHVNDFCSLDKDEKGKPRLWMCYGGGSGLGGYGGYGGYIRRVRFFDFDMNAARVITYKRLEYGDTKIRLDEAMIVDAGMVKGPHEEEI